METAIVAAIAAVAVVMVGRWLYRGLTRSGGGCGCGGDCAKCPSREQADAKKGR